MNTEQKINNKECPQCDGTGKESILLKHKCCRRCKGTGTIDCSERESSFMGKTLVKSSSTKQIEKQSQNENTYDSVDYVNPDDEDSDFLKMLEEFRESDTGESTEPSTSYQISYDEEVNGMDDSLIIPPERSDASLKSGIISMVRSMDNSNSERLITSFQKILQINPDEQTNPPLNTKKAINYVYNCVNNMNSEQLRLAFCITRQFM